VVGLAGDRTREGHRVRDGPLRGVRIDSARIPLDLPGQHIEQRGERSGEH
jgi:hypothetical protein